MEISAYGTSNWRGLQRAADFLPSQPLWGTPNRAQPGAALDCARIFQRQTAATYTAPVASKSLSTGSGALIQKFNDGNNFKQKQGWFCDGLAQHCALTAISLLCADIPKVCSMPALGRRCSSPLNQWRNHYSLNHYLMTRFRKTCIVFSGSTLHFGTKLAVKSVIYFLIIFLFGLQHGNLVH